MLEVAETESCVLPLDVRDAIARYRPRVCTAAQFPLLRDVLRESLTAFAPPNATSGVTGPGAHLARFLVWMLGRPERAAMGGPISVDELFEPGLVDEYVSVGLEGAPPASRATARAVLRRAIDALGGAQRQVLSHSAVKPPYNAEDVARIRALALAQTDPTTRRGVCAVVGLGLGAGLDGRDQRLVCPADIRVHPAEHGVGYIVEVRGARPRSVPVLPQYADLIGEALRLHDLQGRSPDQPLFGQAADRRNVTSPVLAQVRAQGHPVEVEVNRLRSTWLLAMMQQPIPLSALMQVAGLQSARTMAELLPYCPPADLDLVARVVLAAGVAS